MPTPAAVRGTVTIGIDQFPLASGIAWMAMFHLLRCDGSLREKIFDPHRGS
jgi:hypothetical protein